MPETTALTPAQMWTVQQVSEHTGFSKSHVRTLITQRKLSALRVGSTYRIHPDDVQSLITPVSADDDSTGPGAA